VAIASFVISGLLVAAIIGISCYGAVTLPHDARVPLHYGFGGYRNFASRNVALIVWPAAGAFIFAFQIAVSASVVKPDHRGGGGTLIIIPFVLVIIAVSQWGAISVARRNSDLAQQ